MRIFNGAFFYYSVVTMKISTYKIIDSYHNMIIINVESVKNTKTSKQNIFTKVKLQFINKRKRAIQKK